jgi:hypothetical protein
VPLNLQTERRRYDLNRLKFQRLDKFLVRAANDTKGGK